MKIVVISPKTSFRNNQTVERLDNMGAVFYEYTQVNLADVKELYDESDKVLAIDELYIEGGFDSLNTYLPKMKNVKYICGLSSRYHEVDLDGMRQNDITFSNNPGSTTESVAELAFTLMLSITRNLPLHQSENFDFYGINHLGREFKSLKVGIMGFGNIGARIAEICDTNGMEVVFWNRSIKNSSFKQVDMVNLLKQDAIFIALSTTAETKQVITAEFINQLKNFQYLIDITASDALYSKDMVIDLVNAGKLAGFGFEAETSKSKYLPSTGNVLITPHIGWGTKESYHRLYSLWVDTILAANSGKPINVVK